MKKKITFEDKDKFGAPPVNLFTDVDANEIKTAVNELANDVSELDGKIAELENSVAEDEGVVVYFSPAIDFDYTFGATGETAPTYTSEGYFVKNGSVITLWLRIEITTRGNYTGMMALKLLPDYKSRKPTILNVVLNGITSILNNEVAIIDYNIITIQGTNKNSGTDDFLRLENINDNESSMIISGSYIAEAND